MVNVTKATEKKNKKAAETFRKTFFKRTDAELIPIEPQYPFTAPSCANPACHYVMEYFNDLDKLIHYGGASVDSALVDEIKENLRRCDAPAYFTEEQIRSYNPKKVSELMRFYYIWKIK
ncbi:MAG: hypothetical protein RBQ94_00075 [Methanimicrococcus sp.]|nr:hypothetical protein [Methanimicrococcus sp.]